MKVCLLFFTWPSCEAFCLGFRKPFRYLLLACCRLGALPRPGKEGMQLALLVSNLTSLRLIGFVFHVLGPNFILIKAAVTFSSLLPLNIQKSSKFKRSAFQSALSQASDNIDDRAGDSHSET